LASLVGPQGLEGPQGLPGTNGTNGLDGIGGKTEAATGSAITISGLGTDVSPYQVAVNVENGLQINSSKIKLGGLLTGATAIGTTSTNTLAITGLQLGNSVTSIEPSSIDINNPDQSSVTYVSTADQVLVVDSNGVLKQVKAVMPKFFYAPAVYIPTHLVDQNTGQGTPYINGAPAIDLYMIYLQQFGGTNNPTFIASNPSSILPTLKKDDLEFFVTWYDADVFFDVTISSDGILNYKVQNVIPTSKTFMNIVFKVKD